MHGGGVVVDYCVGWIWMSLIREVCLCVLQVLENRVHWGLPQQRNQRSSLTAWLSRWKWGPSTCVRPSGTTPF